MSKRAVIKWNAEKLKTIKRDLLLFDSFYYDPFLLTMHTKLLENVGNIFGISNSIVDEINSNVEYLANIGVLKEFQLREFIKGDKKINITNKLDYRTFLKEGKDYISAYNAFQNKYDRDVEIILKDKNKRFFVAPNWFNDFSIFADYHVRLTSTILSHLNSNFSISPIVDNYENFEFGKERQVVRLVINNLPVPLDIVPIDEVLDFKKDSDNHRRYLGLINWINKICKTDLPINEIKDELNYFTLEFEHRLKLEREKYRLTNLEVIVSLPFEVVEKIIKFNWSKLPKSLFQLKQNKVNLMIGETKAIGRETAYIIYANEKFKPQSVIETKKKSGIIGKIKSYFQSN